MQGVFLPVLVSMAGLAILFAVSWIQFRHIGLAALAALAPLPGFVAALYAIHISGSLSADAAALGYLCAFVAASFLIGAAEMRIVEGASPREAFAMALRVKSVSISAGLLLCAAAPFFFRQDREAFSIAALIVASGASAIFVPWLMRYFTFGEDFIATANRLQETRERGLDWLTFIVQPRWGWSVSGIVLVFAAVAFFGPRNSAVVWPFSSLTSGLTAIAMIGAGYAFIRDGRRATAFAVTSGVLFLITGWAVSKLPDAPSGTLLLAYMLASFPALVLSAQASSFGKAGDSASVATLRMFERSAVSVLTVTGAAMLALFIRLDATSVGAAVIVFFGGIAALVAAPALTTALYDIFPPRISLEDAFRTR